MQEWMEAIIVDILVEHDGEWLIVEFETSSGAAAQKEVPRYDKEMVRPIEVDESDSEDESSELGDFENLQKNLISMNSDTQSIDAFSDSGSMLEEVIASKRIVVQINH